MIFKRLSILAIICTAMIFHAPAPAQTTVIEMFTAPFCAPSVEAETIFHTLRHELPQARLGLICDISEKSCDRRHGEYTRRDVLTIYGTPSFVVNGQHQVKGYNESLLRAHIAMTQSSAPLMPITISRTQDGFALTLPDTGNDSQYYDVWIAAHDPKTGLVKKFYHFMDKRLSASCLPMTVEFDAAYGYTALMHRRSGEIITIGHYNSDDT